MYIKDKITIQFLVWGSLRLIPIKAGFIEMEDEFYFPAGDLVFPHGMHTCKIILLTQAI